MAHYGSKAYSLFRCNHISVFERPFVKRFAVCYQTVVCLSCSVCNVGVLWPNGSNKLGMEVGLGPGHIVLDGDPAPLTKKGPKPPIFGQCLLWPNGWMDYDATWYGVRSRPRRHCVRWGPSCPSPKRGKPPIFGPCLLWPNGWMNQDATWYECRSRPRRHCVRWGLPSSPTPRNGGGHSSPQSAAHVYCGQTAGRIKMPLRTKVGLRAGLIVLDGTQSPKRIFGPCLLWRNGCPSQLLLSTCSLV